LEAIAEAFRGLRERGQKAFIPFVTAGDPDMRSSESLVKELVAQGADLVELGVPFSDPMADGPTIQRSSLRALQNGATLSRVLSLVEKLKKAIDVPIVLFGYANPFYHYGLDRLGQDLASAGVDGLLCVDLPPEEAEEVRESVSGKGIDLIFLLAPTSDSSRVEKVAHVAGGFVYYVSVTGVTGARKSLDQALAREVGIIRRRVALPVCVGFGISTPEQARHVASFADGVVVGSALIDCWEKNLGARDRVGRVGALASRLSGGIHRREGK
jgi:tryptophan synthase alpha chain